jgi:hypothetical protein
MSVREEKKFELKKSEVRKIITPVLLDGTLAAQIGAPMRR